MNRNHYSSYSNFNFSNSFFKFSLLLKSQSILTKTESLTFLIAVSYPFLGYSIIHSCCHVRPPQICIISCYICKGLPSHFNSPVYLVYLFAFILGVGNLYKDFKYVRHIVYHLVTYPESYILLFNKFSIFDKQMG